ncbi:MAG: single-stranded DNA-binding protein [Cyanobacteria bacterium J06659_2]
MPSPTQLTSDVVLIEVLQCLKAIAGQHPPEYQRPLRDYLTDWPAAIGARVLKSDVNGPTHVQWTGHIYTRRSGAGKYGAAIWYSRSKGDGNGNAEYLRLITFKDPAQAEPLDSRVVEALERKKRK